MILVVFLLSNFCQAIIPEPQRLLGDANCDILRKVATRLPETVSIPFEEAVSGISLEGWEDNWVANAEYNVEEWGKLSEPKVDFVHLWVNGTDPRFRKVKEPYEQRSTLNDKEGKWVNSQNMSRYRDWNELRYSFRSVEKYAASFSNKRQLLVTSLVNGKGADSGIWGIRKQIPTWLKIMNSTMDTVEILSHEDFFQDQEKGCLPTFNSMTIENQMHNTKSNIDQFFAMNDDTLLAKTFSASDIYSPLFGSNIQLDEYEFNTFDRPIETPYVYGVKSFLVYTSWLLNQRFGSRTRKIPAHFGSSLSRSINKELMSAFPKASATSATQRFRGEDSFQFHTLYAAFHYRIERHREALLWSYIMLRSDHDGDGQLNWYERQLILAEFQQGLEKERHGFIRERISTHADWLLESAGLTPPSATEHISWTSLDGPLAIAELDCSDFDIDSCLSSEFLSPQPRQNYLYPSMHLYDKLSHQDPKCGDCFIKLLLNTASKGLSPLLPPAETQASKRHLVLKAMKKYQYMISEPKSLFVMVADSMQFHEILIPWFQKFPDRVAMLCLNDDVITENQTEIEGIRKAMTMFFEALYPERGLLEIDA